MIGHPARCIAIVFAAALLWSIAPASAEDVYIKNPSAVIRAGKGAAYEEVATVKKGDKLEVVAREGKWIKVRVGGKEGYLFENAVSDSQVSADNGSLSKAMAGASGASAASSGEAGKGLGESLAWARRNGMSARGLDRMLALRHTVTGRDWETFASEGRVGPNR